MKKRLLTLLLAAILLTAIACNQDGASLETQDAETVAPLLGITTAAEKSWDHLNNKVTTAPETTTAIETTLPVDTTKNPTGYVNVQKATNLRLNQVDGKWYLQYDVVYESVPAEQALSPSSPVIMFESMKEIKNKLLTLSFTDHELQMLARFYKSHHGVAIPDPHNVYEATGLPEGYVPNGLEWRDATYTINYYNTDADQNQTMTRMLFLPMNKAQMESCIAAARDEQRVEDKNYTNLRTSIIQTDLGNTHVYLYDVGILKDWKFEYTEFSYNGIDYIVTSLSYQNLSGNYVKSSGKICAYNGDRSFYIAFIGDHTSLTFEEIVAISLKPTE